MDGGSLGVSLEFQSSVSLQDELVMISDAQQMGGLGYNYEMESKWGLKNDLQTNRGRNQEP